MRQWDVMDPERKQHCRLQAHASVMHKQTGFYTSIRRHIPHHAEMQTQPWGRVNAWRKQTAEAAIATYTIFMGCCDDNRPPNNSWALWLFTRQHDELNIAQPALNAGEILRSCWRKMHAPSKVKYIYFFHLLNLYICISDILTSNSCATLHHTAPVFMFSECYTSCTEIFKLH